MATDWSVDNLPAIWQMLQGDNVCDGQDRVLAWEGLATSVREQHRRLVEAGQNLAEVWPPTTNESARVFLGQLNLLADSMQETLRCAEDTRAGLRGVLEAISQAQVTVASLAQGRAEVNTDWVPRFIDHAEDEYDAQAQQAMRVAESAIADHTTQITAPHLYVLDATNRSDGDGALIDQGGGSSAGGSGTAVRATPVPVPVPHDPVLPDRGNGADPVGASHPGPGSGRDPVPGVGPGLSGVATSPAGPAQGTTAAVGLPAGTGTGGGAGTGGGFGSIPGVGGWGGVGVPGGRPAGSGGRQAVPVRWALPSGAVIGQGQLGGNRPGQPVPGTQGSRRRRTGSADSSVEGDAVDQWETVEGVAPVIAPDTTAVRHDPGPGVLGFDR